MGYQSNTLKFSKFTSTHSSNKIKKKYLKHCLYSCIKNLTDLKIKTHQIKKIEIDSQSHSMHLG